MPRGKGKKARTPNQQQSTRLVVVRGPAFYLPDRLINVMNYSDIISTNAGGATASDHQFRLNSVFDPDLTGTGHQPMGYDQISALYNKYRVLSCRAHVIFMNAQATYGVFGGLSASNNTSAILAGAEISELPFHSKPMLVNRQGGIDVCDGVLAVKLWDILGRTKEQYMSDDLTGAAVGSNPSEAILLHVVAQSTDVTTAVAFTRLVKLEFEVEWYDRVQLSQS